MMFIVENAAFAGSMSTI